MTRGEPLGASHVIHDLGWGQLPQTTGDRGGYLFRLSLGGSSATIGFVVCQLGLLCVILEHLGHE